MKCAIFEECVAKLEAENDRLRKQLNNDSNDSSNWLSTDTKPNAANTQSGRTKTGKKSGGEKGHTGKLLGRTAIEEKISVGIMSRRIIPHGEPVGNYISKYMIDLNIEAIATEHRFYENIDIPPEFRVQVQYGNRIIDMIKSFSDGAFELSDGTVYNFLAEFNAKAQNCI